MQNLVLLNVVGTQQPSTLTELLRAIVECQCNVIDSRSSRFIDHVAASFLLTGNWSALAKFEHSVPVLASRLGISATTRRIESVPPTENALPYSVQIIGHDRPGLLHEITAFFAEQQVLIQELFSNVYRSPYTESPTFVFNLTVHIPQHVAIALMRDSFLMLCDEMNLDAVMEPIKF